MVLPDLLFPAVRATYSMIVSCVGASDVVITDQVTGPLVEEERIQNMIESNKECNDLCAMFSECNLVGNPHEWWMDSGATHHVCDNKELFSLFTLAQVEEMIYIDNSATAKVEGTGKICLKMTSGKVLTLNNVFYVLELRRNLISVSLLDKNGFKCDEAIDVFRQYKTEVENQLDKKIKMIKSDRGGEYESPFSKICVENGKWNRGKEKPNFEGNDECLAYKFWFTAKLIRGGYPYSQLYTQQSSP
ncbi:uncharacterized protein LOC124889572 [Capsicum annuum]|uniref:uncharacterized protein LOC124889572 n=1 Tax=Capsicum annuum TaxID=4072 RepID=UPI001FB0DB40|nr:uncharacterized protein LOC124889572 [Capsicum annuum]